MLWETDHLPYKGLRGEALELKNPLDGVLLSIMNIHTFRATTGCSLNVVFFFQEFWKVCHLSLASTRLLLFTKHYQPIGVTVHSHYVESFEGPYSDVGEGGVAVNWEKT